MLFIALISFIMYEYVLMLIFWCSHCGSTIFVGAGFSYALRLIREDRPHVPMWSQMLTAHLATVVNSCAMKYSSMWKTLLVLLGYLIPQHQIFVNRISAPLRGLIM
jgi:hypothetical protein